MYRGQIANLHIIYKMYNSRMKDIEIHVEEKIYYVYCDTSLLFLENIHCTYVDFYRILLNILI